MSKSRFSDEAYEELSAKRKSMPKEKIFEHAPSATTDNLMKITGTTIREALDSDVNPNSLAIMFFLDHTGSMGAIPETLVKGSLRTLMNTILNHGVADPQVCFGGIGDHYSDRNPIQVGQFESGNAALDQWLTKIVLEGNGGSWGRESYIIALLIAARNTSIDCFEKRGEKGILATCGDEMSHEKLEEAWLKANGYTVQGDLTFDELLAEAQRKWHYFHFHIRHDSGSAEVEAWWKAKIGQNLIVVDSQMNVVESVAGTIALVHGASLDALKTTFGDKGEAVGRAIMHVTSAIDKPSIATAGSRRIE